MNKNEGVLQNVLIVAAIMLSTMTIIAKELSVQEALQKGLIHLHINSSGGYAQNCIELKVKNINNKAIELELEPGVILDNLDEHLQDIIVAKTLKMKLKSNQTIDTTVYGFCCQSSNGSPIKGQKFGFGKKADTLMIKLCRYIDTHKIEPGNAQSAIWTISNNHKLASIGHPNDTSIANLIKICNEKRNEPLPWFYIGYSRLPGQVFSNIPCKVVLNFDYIKKTEKELIIAIYDRGGRKIKTLLANSYAAPGNKSFHFDFDVVNWESGNYKLIVKEHDQAPFTKTFEI